LAAGTYLAFHARKTRKLRGKTIIMNSTSAAPPRDLLQHKDYVLKRIYFPCALSAAAIFLSACSSVPTNTSLLDQTRSDYIAAQSNPKVAAFAPTEMKAASEAMKQANAASDQSETADKVDMLAAVAKQKIAEAQAAAKERLAQSDAASVRAAHD
jgi:hypothetical protein